MEDVQAHNCITLLLIGEVSEEVHPVCRNSRLHFRSRISLHVSLRVSAALCQVGVIARVCRLASCNGLSCVLQYTVFRCLRHPCAAEKIELGYFPEVWIEKHPSCALECFHVPSRRDLSFPLLGRLFFVFTSTGCPFAPPHRLIHIVEVHHHCQPSHASIGLVVQIPQQHIDARLELAGQIL